MLRIFVTVTRAVVIAIFLNGYSRFVFPNDLFFFLSIQFSVLLALAIKMKMWWCTRDFSRANWIFARKCFVDFIITTKRKFSEHFSCVYITQNIDFASLGRLTIGDQYKSRQAWLIIPSILIIRNKKISTSKGERANWEPGAVNEAQIIFLSNAIY